MEDHVRILAILNIVLGALGLLGAVLVLLVFGGIAGVVGMVPDADIPVHAAVPILSVVGGAIFIFLAAISIPAIIAGIGLLQYREWARILTIVLSALNLLNVPFGTALGVYGLWVLLQDRTIALFRNVQMRQYGRA